MQTANILLALGGKRGETVPKYGVTPAEIVVLQWLHGADAVYEIDIQADEVQRTHRQEIERLRNTYSRREGERVISPAVTALFPGVGAQVPQTFADLELPEELFAVAERKGVETKPEPEDDGEKSLDDMTLKELQAHAEKVGVDLTGITRKADVLEALRLHAESKKGDETDENLFG